MDLQPGAAGGRGGTGDGKGEESQYMERHIGDEYEGVISRAMNHYGFFVELPNTVEGMVRLGELDGDYFVFDEEHYELTARGPGENISGPAGAGAGGFRWTGI